MNIRNLAFIICAIILCGRVRGARCENANRTSSVALAISIERITELYLTIVGLIEQYDRAAMPYYSKFFDAALLGEARNVFRQLYGYARNETQGIEWETIAVEFFHLYVIHTSVTQANAHYDYYADVVDKKIGEPCSLRKACLAKLKEQIESRLNSDFSKYSLYDSMLAYLLKSFTLLPVFVVSTNAKPFLVIKLNQYYYQKRFIDEVASADAIAQINGMQKLYMNPMPFSPAENFANEMEIFRRAQASVYRLLYNSMSALQIKELTDAGVNALLNEVVNHYFSNKTSDEHFHIGPSCIRRCALILTFYAFLQDEYNQLVCHPAFELGDNRSTLGYKTKANIIYRQIYLNDFYETFINVACREVVNCVSCDFVKTFQELLRRKRASVGYSLRRRTGIAIVLNANEISAASK